MRSVPDPTGRVPHPGDSCYVLASARWVAVLAVGYDALELQQFSDDEPSAALAVAGAVDLVANGGGGDTKWIVHDRQTGRTVEITQPEGSTEE